MSNVMKVTSVRNNKSGVATLNQDGSFKVTYEDGTEQQVTESTMKRWFKREDVAVTPEVVEPTQPVVAPQPEATQPTTDPEPEPAPVVAPVVAPALVKLLDFAEWLQANDQREITAEEAKAQGSEDPDAAALEHNERLASEHSNYIKDMRAKHPELVDAEFAQAAKTNTQLKADAKAAKAAEREAAKAAKAAAKAAADAEPKADRPTAAQLGITYKGRIEKPGKCVKVFTEVSLEDKTLFIAEYDGGGKDGSISRIISIAAHQWVPDEATGGPVMQQSAFWMGTSIPKALSEALGLGGDLHTNVRLALVDIRNEFKAAAKAAN